MLFAVFALHTYPKEQLRSFRRETETNNLVKRKSNRLFDVFLLLRLTQCKYNFNIHWYSLIFIDGNREIAYCIYDAAQRIEKHGMRRTEQARNLPTPDTLSPSRRPRGAHASSSASTSFPRSIRAAGKYGITE